LDLLIGGGLAAVDEGEVGVGWERWDVEEGEPDVDSVVGGAVFCSGYSGAEDCVPEEGETGGEGVVWRAVAEDGFDC
jgi:hypothetical protein